jgi:hypothetical protein
VLQEEFPRVVLSVGEAEVAGGTRGVLIERKLGQSIARSGHVKTVAQGMVAFELEPAMDALDLKGARLTDCHLPAMFRPRSADGTFGGWRGAVITRHSPNCLHLQVTEGHVVPGEAELLFSPIGSDTGGTRMFGEEGGMMNAADVRSRRIRVRAVTRDVLPGEPGLVTLVVEISRTLYRAA